MGKILREGNFKLGCIHGRITAQKKDSEADIQRNVFLSQKLKIVKSRNEEIIIRLFGYEVPLEKKTRGKCVDLIGYDKDHNLYLIELKKDDSKEQIDKVIRQLNGYADDVEKIIEHIQEDFEKEFFYPIKFKKIIKMIIAPKNFYTDKKLIDGSIKYYGYFRSKDIHNKPNYNITSIHLMK